LSVIIVYSCKIWLLTLGEKYRLRVFENMFLRLILGPKRDENGEWRRLLMEEMHSLYRSPNIAIVIKSRRFTMGPTRSQNGRR
jgi:hypothetical protein